MTDNEENAKAYANVANSRKEEKYLDMFNWFEIVQDEGDCGVVLQRAAAMTERFTASDKDKIEANLSSSVLETVRPRYLASD
jgi:hypothetical protein